MFAFFFYYKLYALNFMQKTWKKKTKSLTIQRKSALKSEVFLTCHFSMCILA